MTMTCCVSWRHVFLFLFALLFIIDVVFDILAVIEWYRGDYFVWFLIGIIVISISFIMQWLYCLNNMNLYLNYLQSYKYSGWNNYNHYLNFDDTHYVENTRNNNKNISKCKEITFMTFKFLFKSIIIHLLLQLGIIEAFINNCIILKRYNTKSKTKKNIFDFDPKNNYNAISKYPNPVLQFNTNYIIANVADICILHAYFESVIMSLLHATFFLSHFVFNMDKDRNDYLFSIYLCGFISSMLSMVIFVFNFEKAKMYPSYFEYDTLSRIKYIFPDLYLYPSTYSIYQITNTQNKSVDGLPPPTCHYPTNNNAENINNPDLPSCSDIFLDQNNHHDINNKSFCDEFVLFLCNFTFYLYLFCDFCCRTSPFILSFIQLSISQRIRNGIDVKSEWLFWMNISFLIVFTLYLTVHFIWIHYKYSDYFKPSAPFWRYTIKKYLKCHYIHPLLSILDTEPLFAWLTRNCLFWFGVIIICNISIFGLIFNRPTLYSRKEAKKWNKIRKKVERSLIIESLMRYFLGFIMILVIVIFDSFYNDRMFYFVAIWTFMYCIFVLFCCFIILKLSRCSLLRLDGVWIEKVSKRGWLLSRNEEGILWHRNYNKAQSFQIKRKEKHFRAMQHKIYRIHRMKQQQQQLQNDEDNNEQQIIRTETKTLKQNDCSNNINININIDTLSNTTLNSSNINVKISCINPSNISKTNSIQRPKPSILRTKKNKSSSEPPPQTSTPIKPNNTTLSSSPPHYPPPQLSLYHHSHSHPNIFEINNSSSSSSLASSRRIMLMDEEQSEDDLSDDDIAIIHPNIEIFRKTTTNHITKPQLNAVIDNHKYTLNNISQNKQMVSVEWHKGDINHTRLSWTQNDMKYPLKWLMNNNNKKKSPLSEDKRNKLNKMRDDMLSIDETGAFLKHESSDTSSSDTLSKALSFDEINTELNKKDNTLSINIQHTNTKLFDTLRKLSSQQSKGSYHNIPNNQRNIICDNSSDDSICYDLNNMALLVQSYTNHVGDETQRHKSMTPTITHSLLNDIGCNIDDD